MSDPYTWVLGSPGSKYSEKAAQIWSKGMRRITVQMICCEECGSVRTRKRDGRKAHAVRWECTACAHTWREPEQVGAVRGCVA